MRTQLSLFVPPSAVATLEAVRRLVDPVQAALIPAHVTLCREADLTGITPSLLQARLASESTAPLTLHFGAAAHPRNPRAPGNEVANSGVIPAPLEISFCEVQ